ncbi:hypothetical protein ACFQUU_26115 [Herbaspirillum sp. GCM10030257]|uniref:hypothetical protein n=1 Tax=Herbaspirillum sp. GCM10030257 TaxID=3273393 RepID=UPI0036171F23
MSIAKHRHTKLDLLSESSAANIYDVIITFLEDGRIKAPLTVNLNSFEPNLLRDSGFDLSGDPNEHYLYAWTRYFSSKRRKICTEFKLYFYQNRLRTNGLGIVSKIRLSTLLKKIHEKELLTNSKPHRFEIYLDNGLKEGALLFENGILMQFSTADKGSARNYYIKTVESNFDESTQFDMKKTNTNFVRSMFKKYDYANLSKKKCKSNHAIQKLICLATQFSDLLV